MNIPQTIVGVQLSGLVLLVTTIVCMMVDNHLASIIIFCSIVYCVLSDCGLEENNITEVSSKVVCHGETISLKCQVQGSGTTVWKGSSFDCPHQNNELALLHNQLNNSDQKQCYSNGSTIKAYAKIITSDENCSTSQLNVTIKLFNSEQLIINITCEYDNGTNAEPIASYLIAASPCGATDSEDDDSTRITLSRNRNDTPLITGVSIAVVLGIIVFGSVIFSCTVIVKKRRQQLQNNGNIQHVSVRLSDVGLESGDVKTRKAQREAYNRLCFDRSVSITNWEYNRPETMTTRKKEKNSNYSKLSAHKRPTQCIVNTSYQEKVLDLDSLLIKLRSRMDSKLWYQLGLELGVPVNFLETLIGYPDDDCLVEVLDNWLRNHPDKPTWDEIEKALQTFVDATQHNSPYDIPVQLMDVLEAQTKYREKSVSPPQLPPRS